MKGVECITARVEWSNDVSGDLVTTKTPVPMERFKILREGTGYEYTPTNHNNSVRFSCCRKHYIELVFDGDFSRMYPRAIITTIRVQYPDHTSDIFYNCELKQVQQKDRISYLLVEAD